MSGILYEADAPWVFIVLTVVLGGAAAFQTGRACAQTWRPSHHLILYMLILGIAVRFLHFALFQETLLSIQFYVIDVVILIAFGLLGWRIKRVQQMVTQYSWIYESAGSFGWHEKSAKQ